jgi:hypothetical protein
MTVPVRYLAGFVEGLNEYERTTGLSLSTVQRIRTGGRRIAENTEKSYTKHYNGLEAFAAMIGSYSTCFVLSYKAPSDFCPSMDDTAVALYMLY